MANVKVTVGYKAQIFHDQSTGITVCKGDVVVLRDNQYKSRKVQQAINSGHLILVRDKDETVSKYSKADVKKLQDKMKAQYEKGMEIEKMAGSFTLEEAKLLAEHNSVVIEETDTVESILKAILEED